MYVVTITNQGQVFYLRSTTWAFSLERADRFETPQAAMLALDKAKRFTQPKLWKRAVVEAV